MNIHLHIDRIVLDGVGASEDQSRVVHAAVQEELVRLLARDGVAPALLRGGAIPALIGGSIEVGSAPESLGTSIGRAVHAGMASVTLPGTEAGA